MAHARQKATLGLAGRVRLKAGVAQFFLHLLEPSDVDVRAGNAQRPAARVTRQDLATAEQPEVIAATIEIAVLCVEVLLAAVSEQLAQVTQTFQIVGVYALVELAQRQVIRTQAKSPNEALAEIDGQISGIDLPEAFSCTLQHQLQNALRLLPLMLAGLELLAGLLHGIGQATDLGDMTVRHGWQILALAQAGRHVDDAIDGLGQLRAQLARTQPHQGEKQQIERCQTGDQQVADLHVTLGQLVGFLENLLLVHHQQQAPAGLRYFAPGH